MCRKVVKPTPQLLAIAFCRRFRSHLIELYGEDYGRRYLEEAVALNAAEADLIICHSHDHCDANQSMIDALESLGASELHFVFEYDPPDDERLDCERNTELINRAWSLAKESGFSL